MPSSAPSPPIWELPAQGLSQDSPWKTSLLHEKQLSVFTRRIDCLCSDTYSTDHDVKQFRLQQTFLKKKSDLSSIHFEGLSKKLIPKNICFSNWEFLTQLLLAVLLLLFTTSHHFAFYTEITIQIIGRGNNSSPTGWWENVLSLGYVDLKIYSRMLLILIFNYISFIL